MERANVAGPGELVVCGECGKTSKTIYGDGNGWDESCMLNAVLCDETTIERNSAGRIVSAQAVKRPRIDDDHSFWSSVVKTTSVRKV